MEITMIHEEYMKLKEERKHGNFLLPYMWYYTDIPKFFSSFPMHWHEEYEIIKLFNGHMNISIDLESYVMNPGDIAIIKPGVLHSFSQFSNEHAETVSCIFNNSMLSSPLMDACSIKYFTPLMEGKYNFPPIIRNGAKGHDKLVSLIDEMFDTFDAKEAFYEIKLKSLLYDFLYVVLSECCDDYSGTSINDNDTNTIKNVLDYIKMHYMEPITIAELADAAGLSEHYFMRFFKSNIGMTCVEYINEYRLNIATHLLKESDYPIGVIAEKCGISNVSYFNRIFKKSFNMTPKDYRKNK